MTRVLVAALVLLASVTAHGQPRAPQHLRLGGDAVPVVLVSVGGDLLAALHAVPCGGEVRIPADTSFDRGGSLYLPAKGCQRHTTLTTAGATYVPGVRRQCTAKGLGQIRSTAAGEPAIKILGPGGYWRLVAVAISKTRATDSYGLVRIGSQDTSGPERQGTLAQVPQHVEILGSYIYPPPGMPERRGVLLNGTHVRIEDSCIGDFWATDGDSQAIAGLNGPGPFVLRNNTLGGGSEVILFGGGDPTITGLLPCDILIEGNDIGRPLAWLGQNRNVKNLIELKAGCRVTVRGNILRNNWREGQDGMAVLLTPQNQDGGCWWCAVYDVTFEHNLFLNVAGGFQITGHDADHDASGPGERIRIRHNFIEMNPALPGVHRAFELSHMPCGLEIERNTILNGSTWMVLSSRDGPTCDSGLVVDGNIGRHGGPSESYGIIADGRIGAAALSYYYGTRVVWQQNVMADPVTTGYGCGIYPAGTSCPTQTALQAAFLQDGGDPLAGDYRLKAGVPWQGVDWDALLAELRR